MSQHSGDDMTIFTTDGGNGGSGCGGGGGGGGGASHLQIMLCADPIPDLVL